MYISVAHIRLAISSGFLQILQCSGMPEYFRSRVHQQRESLFLKDAFTICYGLSWQRGRFISLKTCSLQMSWLPKLSQRAAAFALLLIMGAIIYLN